MIFKFNNQKYCFIHIPKTGGTYIEIYILKHIYGEDTINLNNWRSFMNKHLYTDIKNNNSYHIPYQCGGIDNPESYQFFSVIRDPIEVRMSAYNWLVKTKNYTKSFQEYMNEDYLILPTDNISRCSTFGLSQKEYVKGSNAKIFLYEDFDKLLDYIDNIFHKPLPRFNKINTSESNISIVDTSIQHKIKSIFEEDYLLIRQIKSSLD